jgi:hypothetical protein
MSLRKLSVLGVFLSLGVLTANAKSHHTAPLTPLTPAQTALVVKSVEREKITVKAIRNHIPLVQTYIQNMRPDPKFYAVPISDNYMLNRVDFGKSFVAKAYEEKTASHGMFRGSFKAITGLTKAFQMNYSSTGFMDMMFVDPIGYDLQHYDFGFVRRDFLGSVRTMVFDVQPKKGSGAGRFFGRIWIEDEGGNIVRFNGSYTSNPNKEGVHYFHFDSWRNNLEPENWLPVAIYVEETQRSVEEKSVGFRAQTYFWGYSLKLPSHEGDNESIQVENATDQSENSQDVSPLQAQREWVSQAEQNVLDRLVQAGLLAPVSDFDKILEQVVNNIVIGNKLVLPADIHCRVMLTTPLESLAIGNTILLSKGLVDVLPYEEDLAAVLSFQLAQIVLGHHIDTRYAFNDRLLFPDESTFQRIKMNHTDQDNADAAKKAQELLSNSIYHDKMPNVGLFFAQLQLREKNLPALVTPRLGDSLIRPDGTAWLADATKGAPRLDPDNLTQIAALPIGSRLKIDPWDDKVIFLNSKPVPLLNAGDKMPLELTPIFFRLSRYTPPSAIPAAAPATGTPAPAPTNGSAQAPADAPVPAPPPAQTQQ